MTMEQLREAVAALPQKKASVARTLRGMCGLASKRVASGLATLLCELVLTVVFSLNIHGERR